jgi:hypothetical protein
VKQDRWSETTATVFSCGWQETPGRFLVFRQLSDLFSGRYLVVFSHMVDGHQYSGEFTSSREWQEGSNFSLRFDPENPERNDRTDPASGPLATIAAWVVGIILCALYIWWRSRK